MSRRLRLFTLFIVLAALWLAGLFSFVRTTADMRPPEEIAGADAIVVLTGGSNRIEEGFELLKKGAAAKLFISGVQRGVEVKQLMALTRQESEDKIECCIDIGSAENTIENAVETAEWLEHQKFTSFYLVTANYHMQRALLEFENVAPDVKIIPWPVTPAGVDMQAWWADGAFRAVMLKEYTKYLLERLRYALLGEP